MKMYAVKETKVAGLICASIESEHGKIEMVFEGWAGETDSAQFMARYIIDFAGECIQIHECADKDFCQGDFKQAVNSFTSCAPYIPYNWEEMGPCMCEYSEAYQLLASATSYINNMLFNC